MSNLKTTLITAVTGLTVATAGLFALPSPEAQARECAYGDGYSLCFDYVTREGSLTGWLVDFRNNHTTEEFEIICHDNKTVVDWESKGGLSQNEANTIAEYFCSL